MILKAEIIPTGRDIIIKPELVPVTALREGKDAMRIGVDFTQKLTTGSIVVRYSLI